MASLPTPELATASDLVEFLEDQHVAIRTLFDAALSPEKGIDSGSFTRLRGLLAVHETVEAMVVHPWSRGISEAGRTVANTRLAEELALTTDLEQLEATAVGSPEFIVGLAALRSATLEHCRLEEEEEFPMLRRTRLSTDAERALPSACPNGSRPLPSVHPLNPRSPVPRMALTGKWRPG